MVSEDAKEKPRAPREPVLEPAARADIRVASSAVRCPFCHEPLSPEAEAWVACKSCLARHHPACWAEARRCATCANEVSIAADAGPDAWQSRLFFLGLAVILMSLVVLAVMYAAGNHVLPW